MNAKHERNSSMPIKAADFFTSVVKPTVEEFLRDTGDRRRGFLAAIVLYHMADYWGSRKQSYKDITKHIAPIPDKKMSRVCGYP